MALTPKEKQLIGSGEKQSLARSIEALYPSQATTGIVRVIAAGDFQALVKASGATGAVARAIGSGDDNPNLLTGLL